MATEVKKPVRKEGSLRETTHTFRRHENNYTANNGDRRYSCNEEEYNTRTESENWSGSWWTFFVGVVVVVVIALIK